MTARKLQQEIDKCFKKVEEGVQTFESIYDKIVSSSNPSQKEKLEDSLKKEIKKLQRHRDQIKGWATQNDIKDKKPLLDKRKLIETQMEKFKAVEKEMKTKAYSKEGLNAATKLDPREQEKQDMYDFLSEMVDSLERQIEQAEAETETLSGTTKKGKKDVGRGNRITELENMMERHKFHQKMIETMQRRLENGDLDTDQVKGVEDSIRYYVDNNQEVDFLEDDTLYDEFNLEEEELGEQLERLSSQDAQSVTDEPLETVDSASSANAVKPPPAASSSSNKHKQPTSTSESTTAANRRPSAQLKSPLPALATLNSPLATVTNGTSSSAAHNSNNMRPAPAPTRAAGEPLKYASAAAAAAAGSDKSGIGIAPLPPPPGMLPRSSSPAYPQQPPTTQTATSSATAAARRPSTTTSPAAMAVQPTTATTITATAAAAAAATVTAPPSHHAHHPHQPPARSPAPSHASATASATGAPGSSSIPPTPALSTIERTASSSAVAGQGSTDAASSVGVPTPLTQRSKLANGGDRGDVQVHVVDADSAPGTTGGVGDEESVYHLPSSLSDLLETFETTKSLAGATDPIADEAALAASHAAAPKATDSERPLHYRPDNPYPWPPAHYPQEPLPIFNDQALYGRVDPDVLFYAFYYRQGTYQQYLAAQALKQQSWRFHKQYQTWFQRHEEPKTITEEFEQGTYRFFDYESTWMNRRKQDFKFQYRWLEDDLQ